MTNIKKIIIFILVLFLILIFKRRKQLENFFDQKYIGGEFLNNDVNHSADLININVDFFYKDACSISRQFLYGCCKPYNEKERNRNKLKQRDIYSIEGNFDPLGGVISSNSLYQKDEEGNPYHKIKNELQNPRWDETHCMDHEGNKLKSCFRKNYELPDAVVDSNEPFERTEFYQPGNTCMPIDYFNYTDKETGSKKPGCLLNKNLNNLRKPTFYYLKRFIDYVNHVYSDEIEEMLNNEEPAKKLTSWLEEKQGVISGKNFRNKDELKFHIHLKIISSKDEIRTKGISQFPLIRLSYLNKINKGKEFPDNLNYTKFDYPGDVNNICDVAKFIGEKIVLEATNDELDFKLDSEEYARKYYNFNSEYDVLYLFEPDSEKPNKVVLDKEGVDKVKNPLDESPGTPSRINFVNYLFEKFKKELKDEDDEFECPSPVVIPFNINKKFRQEDINERASSKLNYLGTRPKLQWMNIPFDISNVMIVFQDKELYEDYGSLGRRKLLYWMMWNIPRNDNNLPEKTYAKVENIKDKSGNKVYYELYPYKLFNPEKTPQTIRKNIEITEDNILKEDFLDSIIQRRLDVEIKVYALTFEDQEKLIDAYEKFSKYNLTKFYEKFLTIVDNIPGKYSGNFMEKREIEGDSNKNYFSIKYNLGKEDYLKLNQIQNNLKQQGLDKSYKILVAKSNLSNNFEYVSETNRVINLGHKSCWILRFNNTNGGKIHIDNNVFIPDEINNCYYIPYKCNKVQIYSKTWNGTINYLESSREIYKYEWYDRITTFKDDITYLGYGIKHESKDYKFKSYHCYQEETSWLVNFGITQNRGQAKFVFNDSLIVDTREKNFNCMYITEKIQKLEFTAQIPRNCELLNASIMPVIVKELDLQKVVSPNDFIVVSSEKFVSRRVTGSSSDNVDDKKFFFKMESRGNYLVQIKVIDDPQKKTVLKINDTQLKTVDNVFYNLILSDVKDINLEINFNDLSSGDNVPKIYYPKIIKIDTEITSKNRITTINHDILNCKYSNRLPELSWNYLDLDNKDINSDVDSKFNINNDSKLLYAIEVFNAENEDEVFYLEWDIKDKKTNCRLFRNTIDDEEEIHTPVNLNKKIRNTSLINFVGNENYNYNTNLKYNKFDTLKSGKVRSVYSINDQNCYLGKVSASNEFNLPNMINIKTIRSDDKKANLKIFDKESSKKFNLGTGGTDYMSEDFKILIKYNREIGKWMIWNKPSANSNLLIWVGIQESGGELSCDFEKNWIFSPKFKDESFNFYDYPSQGEQNIKIKRDDPKVLKVKMKIVSEKFVNTLRCDDNEDIASVNKTPSIEKDDIVGQDYINRLNQNYGNRFKNSLFRILNRVNLNQSQDKFELLESYEGDKKEAKLVYNLKMKVRVHSYSKEAFENVNDIINFMSDKPENLLLNTQSRNFELDELANTQVVKDSTSSFKNLKRMLSEQVKKMYINKEILEAVIPFIKDKATNLVRKMRKSVFKKDLDLLTEDDVVNDIDYRTFMDVEDCLSEILICRGDLSRVKERYLPLNIRQAYINKTYYSMDETDEKVIANESSFPVINTDAVINPYFIKIFREYMGLPDFKVMNNNYSSYGDLSLGQNETMLIYRIPVDINCPKFKKHLVCKKEDVTDSIILTLKQKFANFLNSFYNINNILLEIDEFLFSPKSKSFLTEQLKEFVNDTNDGIIVKYEQYDNIVFFKNSEIIKKQLRIIEITREIEEIMNKILPPIERMNRFIGEYEENKAYKKKKKLLFDKLKNDIQPKYNELNKIKHELMLINDKFNFIGITLFTNKKIGEEDEASPAGSLSPSYLENIEIPEFDNINQLEEKLLKTLGEQFENEYLNKSTLKVPSNGNLFYKIFNDFHDSGAGAGATAANESTSAPPLAEINEFTYKPLPVEEFNLSDTFVQRENFNPNELINSSLEKKKELKEKLTLIINDAKINELKEIIKEGVEKCKLLKQYEQENIVLQNFISEFDLLKNTIRDNVDNENIPNDIFSLIYNNLNIIKDFKKSFGEGEQYLVEDNCEASSYSITSDDSQIYSQINNTYEKLKLIKINDDKNIYEYMDIKLDGTSSTDSFGVFKEDPNIKNYFKEIINIELETSEIPELIENIRNNDMVNLRNNFIKKIDILNKKIGKLGIQIFDLPEEINFEKPGILHQSINKKIEEMKEMEITTDNNVKYLTEVKAGIESTSNFDAKVKKIVDFLNLQHTLIPIVNAYSKPFIKVKSKLENVIEELKNSNDINVSQEADLQRKKEVLVKNQYDIQLLDNMLNEIRQSSSFVLDKYQNLFPKPKNETVPDITATIGAEAPMFTVEGSTEKQRLELEKQKKNMNPMDIARVYRDMIYNVFDKD
jgi:hypothetical protein